MDFKNLIADISASLIIFLRRVIFLIFSPYKTLRNISFEDDHFQLIIIFGLIFIYFQLANKIKKFILPPSIIFLFFLLSFLLTTLFFYFLSLMSQKKIQLKSFFFTLSYSLIPTLIWFTSNSLFYLLIPPPRRITPTGKAFSIFFITFSISLLFWKIILSYLAIRFSSKLNFYRVVYLIILYLCVFFPYSIVVYHFKIFRIPFI